MLVHSLPYITLFLVDALVQIEKKDIQSQKKYSTADLIKNWKEVNQANVWGHPPQMAIKWLLVLTHFTAINSFKPGIKELYSALRLPQRGPF